MTTHFEYKCRKCGEIFVGQVSSEYDTPPRYTLRMLSDPSVTIISDNKRIPDRTTLHYCSANSAAIADIVGYTTKSE